MPTSSEEVRHASAAERTVDILKRLIAFDTVSRNSNLALIVWIENYLEPTASGER